MNRPLTPDEAEDMRGLVLRCVAETERDRLIGVIVRLLNRSVAANKLLHRCHGALQQTGDDDWILSPLACDLRQHLQKKIDAQGKFCDSPEK